MTLNFPLGLLGLFSLPVILALHMMRERKKRIEVSSLKLWKFLEPEVHGPQPKRISFSWLLFFDLLIAALLSFSLAQPIIKFQNIFRATKNYVILIDNSTSMLTRDVLPDRFSQAKKDITQLLSELGTKNSAVLISFNATPTMLGDTTRQNPEILISTLNNLKAGATGNSLRSGLAIGETIIKQDVPTEFWVFTDAAFQNPNVSDFPYPIHWKIYGNNNNNQAIVDLSLLNMENDRYQVFAQLANFSDSEVYRNVTLFVDDKPIDSLSVHFQPHSVYPQIWTQKGKPTSISIALVGNDSLKEDDSAVIGFSVNNSPKVEFIGENFSIIDKSKNIFPDLQIFSPEEYVEQSDIDLTIFENFWPNQWPAGTSLILQPPAGFYTIDNQNYSVDTQSVEIPADAVVEVNSTDTLLNGIDLSGIRWGIASKFVEIPSGFQEVLTTHADQQVPLLLRGKVGMSTVYILTIDITQGNLTRHPIFPILLSKLLSTASISPLPTTLSLGKPILLPDETTSYRITITDPNNHSVEFAGTKDRKWDTTGNPGIYKIDVVGLDGSEDQSIIGVNAGDIQESNIAIGDWVQSEPQSGQEEKKELSPDFQLAPWLLVLTIIFLLIEAVIAWR